MAVEQDLVAARLWGYINPLCQCQAAGGFLIDQDASFVIIGSVYIRVILDDIAGRGCLMKCFSCQADTGPACIKETYPGLAVPLPGSC